MLMLEIGVSFNEIAVDYVFKVWDPDIHTNVLERGLGLYSHPLNSCLKVMKAILGIRSGANQTTRITELGGTPPRPIELFWGWKGSAGSGNPPDIGVLKGHPRNPTLSWSRVDTRIGPNAGKKGVVGFIGMQY